MRTISKDRTQPRRGLSPWATCLLAILALLPTTADAIQLPSLSLRRNDCVTVAGLRWHTDYASACEEAACEKKMLLVNFVPSDKSGAQRGLEKSLHENSAVRAQLEDYVLLRVRDDERVRGMMSGLLRRNRGRLMDDAAFKHLGRSAGLAIVDYQNAKEPFYGKVVTALPYQDGKYYRWKNSHLAVALGLPAGTITQRTMVWAVRTHPEEPLSTTGKLHPALAAAAAKQSAYQASIGVQGHQNWETRFHQVVARTHAGTASEVVAESWENQDLIDSCIDCVKSWRHSPGHWSAVSSSHRLYGYDIRQGTNGIWYGTGIFAN
jgi:hypothetical protein